MSSSGFSQLRVCSFFPLRDFYTSRNICINLSLQQLWNTNVCLWLPCQLLISIIPFFSSKKAQLTVFTFIVIEINLAPGLGGVGKHFFCPPLCPSILFLLWMQSSSEPSPTYHYCLQLELIIFVGEPVNRTQTVCHYQGNFCKVK